MAAASITIYLNSILNKNIVRIFGGNKSEVRKMHELYQNMTKEDFIIKHPKFADMCKDKFKLYIFYR